MAHRTWNVHVIRDGRTLHLGPVDESSEAPHKPDATTIYPDEDFDVTPAG